MIQQGAPVACHEAVAAIPVKGVILGGIDENDLHVLEDLQPTRHPVPPPDIAIQWRQLAEKAYPRTLHVAFPTGVSFLGSTHQTFSCLLDALRICDAKPLHSLVGPKREVRMGVTALQPESRVLQAPWAAPFLGAFWANPQNNYATSFPIHLTATAFSQTHSPIDASTVHASLSHALSSNDHTGTRGCHAHHTRGRVKGWRVNSDHTACYQEAGRALLQHQRPSTALSTSLCLKAFHH